MVIDNETPAEQTWAEETAEFYTPGEPRVEPVQAERAPDGKFKAKEPEPETKTDDEAGEVEPNPDLNDKDAADTVEGRKGDLPEWLQKRIGRVSKKEADLATREAQLAEREAKVAKPDAAKDDGAPDPLGFLPAHIDKDEFRSATDFAIDSLPKDHGIFSDKLKISADVALAMTDIADGDKARMVEVADFVVNHPAIIDAINELPPRKRPAAFEKAFGEAAPAEAAPAKPTGKKASDAPPPISRSKASAAVNANDFKTFEQIRNEEDRAAGYRT